MLDPNVILMISAFGSLLLLSASAFFSGSETALVSLSPQKAKRLALKNPKMAQALLEWIRQPHDLLTLILVGNTLVNVMFAACVTALLVFLFKTISPSVVESIAWIFETMMLVVLGDMIPKFFARSNPEKTSLLVLPLLSRLRWLIGPINFMTSVLSFLFPKGKKTPVGSILMFSMQELQSLLEETQVSEKDVDEHVDMMQRVLDINRRRADEIMTPLSVMDFVEVDPKGKPMRKADLLLDLIIEEGHTRTPLKFKGEIIGFIHSDDLLPLMIKSEEVDLPKMVRKAMDVPFDRLVSDLLHDFRTSGIYAGFVRDKFDKVIGIVTLEDVLEEITGEIIDEFDEAHT